MANIIIIVAIIAFVAGVLFGVGIMALLRIGGDK